MDWDGSRERKRDIGLMLIALAIILAVWWFGVPAASGQTPTPVFEGPLPYACARCDARLPLIAR